MSATRPKRAHQPPVFLKDNYVLHCQKKRAICAPSSDALAASSNIQWVITTHGGGKAHKSNCTKLKNASFIAWEWANRLYNVDQETRLYSLVLNTTDSREQLLTQRFCAACCPVAGALREDISSAGLTLAKYGYDFVSRPPSSIAITTITTTTVLEATGEITTSSSDPISTDASINSCSPDSPSDTESPSSLPDKRDFL